LWLFLFRHRRHSGLHAQEVRMSMVFTHLCFGSATRLLRGGGIALIALLFAGCVSDQSGTREIFYRKSDLASYQDTVNSVIVARSTPRA